MNDNAILCYVDEHWAYFTTNSLDKQWGDDWNDAPYWCNAGDPYSWREYMGLQGVPKYEVFRVAWDGNLSDPSEYYYGTWLSVQDINTSGTPWLQTPKWEPPDVQHVFIRAGTTFATFKEYVRLAGGTVYVPFEEG